MFFKGIGGNAFNFLRNIYKKSTANIIFSGKRINLSPRSEIRQGCLLSIFLCNIVLEALASAICSRPKKKKKRHPYGEGWNKVSLFSENIIVCIGNSKNSTITTLIINEVSNVVGYKMDTPKSILFVHTSNKQSMKKLKLHYYLQLFTKERKE